MTREEIQRKISEWDDQLTTTGSIEYRFSDIKGIIDSLCEITGRGETDDPFNNWDTLFLKFSQMLATRINYKQFAIYSFKRLYERCLELEIENNIRMHKGDALHWIGRYYYEIGNHNMSCHFWILTYLEDILSEFYRTSFGDNIPCMPDSLNAPVFQTLQLYFDIPAVNLIELINVSKRLLDEETDTVFNPEILQFKLRNKGCQVPKLINYQSPIRRLLVKG